MDFLLKILKRLRWRIFKQNSYFKVADFAWKCKRFFRIPEQANVTLEKFDKIDDKFCVKLPKIKKVTKNSKIALAFSKLMR